MKKEEMEIHPITFKMVKKSDLEKEIAEIDRRAKGAWGKCWPDIPCPIVKPLDKAV